MQNVLLADENGRELYRRANGRYSLIENGRGHYVTKGVALDFLADADHDNRTEDGDILLFADIQVDFYDD